jgi:signal transduction histidine kinase
MSEEDKVQTLDVIIHSGERMLTLIQNLLSNSALEMGKIAPDFTECNLLTIVSEVIIANTTRAQHKEQNISFHYDDSSFAMQGDTSLLYELCDNLLSNAVKYSPLKGAIVVSLKAVTTEAEPNNTKSIQFSVRDNGPGLSEDDKTKLFGYFQRLSAQPTGGESSHGIGLAIALRIAEIHHGTIHVESRADEGIPGAIFIVELPITKSEILA